MPGGTAEIAEPGERRPTVIGVIDGPGPTSCATACTTCSRRGRAGRIDPFAADVAGGRIYARGAANSKAALAGGAARLRLAPAARAARCC